MSRWFDSEFEQAYERAESVIHCALEDAVNNDEPVDREEIQRGIDLLLELVERI